MKSEKILRRNGILLIGLLFASFVLADYEITWYTIDGGGGTSSGGDYVLVGTAGQPDAGVSSGGDYVLNSGYWASSCGCVVNMTDLANFIQQWLFAGSGLEADLWPDDQVNLEDFAELSYWWMHACPPDWPLK